MRGIIAQSQSPSHKLDSSLCIASNAGRCACNLKKLVLPLGGSVKTEWILAFDKEPSPTALNKQVDREFVVDAAADLLEGSDNFGLVVVFAVG